MRISDWSSDVCSSDLRMARESGMELLVYQNPEAKARGINPFDHGPLHTDMWKTAGLKQALDLHGFDVAFGGARRDEEKSRAQERIFPSRPATHGWAPKQQRHELLHPHNPPKAKRESIRDRKSVMNGRAVQFRVENSSRRI